ncbi:MAG: metallophosphoesterase [Dehalococcoidales bacterium]|nr:metallophosphoesterase [Dehalococcoidales bacterium]
MTRFILSDLHIGHKDAQYEIMDRAIAYIRREAKPGDEIWGLGDWFHMYENGFDYCLQHPMTKKFCALAAEIPTKLLPGNHDHILEKYRDTPGLVNPLAPIKLIEPFMDGGIWYCHGHEYDPSVQYIPYWLMWLWNHLPQKKTTPGRLRLNFITERYIMLVYLVHSRALLHLQDKVKKEHAECTGIVLGHTHLPLYQRSPELLFLLNDGDMRHSGTFTIENKKEFRHMTWKPGQQQWQVINIPKN